MKKPHILKTTAVLTISLLLAPTIVRAEANDTGIAIPPKPAASDGQIVVYENVATGRISQQNGICGAPDKHGTANFAAWKAAEFPYSRTHDLNICPVYGMPFVIDVPWIFLMMYPCSFVYIETEGTRK